VAVQNRLPANLLASIDWRASETIIPSQLEVVSFILSDERSIIVFTDHWKDCDVLESSLPTIVVTLYSNSSLPLLPHLDDCGQQCSKFPRMSWPTPSNIPPPSFPFSAAFIVSHASIPPSADWRQSKQRLAGHCLAGIPRDYLGERCRNLSRRVVGKAVENPLQVRNVESRVSMMKTSFSD